eukprot:g5729.t1
MTSLLDMLPRLRGMPLAHELSQTRVNNFIDELFSREREIETLFHEIRRTYQKQLARGKSKESFHTTFDSIKIWLKDANVLSPIHPLRIGVLGWTADMLLSNGAADKALPLLREKVWLSQHILPSTWYSLCNGYFQTAAAAAAAGSVEEAQHWWMKYKDSEQLLYGGESVGMNSRVLEPYVIVRKMISEMKNRENWGSAGIEAEVEEVLALLIPNANDDDNDIGEL